LLLKKIPYGYGFATLIVNVASLIAYLAQLPVLKQGFCFLYTSFFIHHK